LEQHADEPFFPFVHYWDPHIPYNVPQGSRGMPERFRGKFNQRVGDLELNDRALEEREILAELEAKLHGWVEHHLAGERTDPMLASDGAWTCYIGKRGDS
jgi:hypothetical protein